MTGSALANPRATRDFLRMRLRDLPHEVFCCVYLDNRHRVIAFEELFRGTIDGASVHPREVVKQALARNAAAVILVHNHPSGLAEPSQADELITRRLKEALGLVDIRVLDHLVVGDAVCESFAERGSALGRLVGQPANRPTWQASGTGDGPIRVRTGYPVGQLSPLCPCRSGGSLV